MLHIHPLLRDETWVGHASYSLINRPLGRDSLLKLKEFKVIEMIRIADFLMKK